MTRTLAPRDRRRRLVGRLLTLIVLVGVAYLLVLVPAQAETPASTTLRLGFLLLASYLAGHVARGLSLPQITGYLILGVLIGPDVLGILGTASVERLRAIDEIALSVIALSAGGELRLASVRKRFRSIAMITLAQLVMVFLLVAAVVFTERNLFDFLRGEEPRVALAVALLFGLVAVAKSPATTIAVITEEKAHGPVTDVVLGITVIKDVLILVLTALMIPLAAVIARPARAFDSSALEQVLLTIVASLAVGALFGWIIARALRHVEGRGVLLVLAAAFLSVQLSEMVGLEYILLSMSAGFVVQNYSDEGRGMIAALEANSLPIFALFFALAGAEVDLQALGLAWKIAAVVLLARFVALWAATYVGARLAHAEPAIRKRAWTGFVAMAGVSLGIAHLIRDRFPELGASMATIIIALIAVNQLLGPPLFRWALVRSGESGAAGD
ncbi:MAG TPA: cation:proton antiporter [Longimicrobiales bacterium]|nr:cation:proton antiporter [Longimicrobiales bacterium]